MTLKEAANEPTIVIPVYVALTLAMVYLGIWVFNAQESHLRLKEHAAGMTVCTPYYKRQN